MFSTCLFCNQSLGRNEVIEHFPVGRRLAFDAERGRLWVVCSRCAGWNLSPLEERWEAIEEAERLYRETRLRVSTEHIGLARARDGTDLIRVGRPQRPELAAWRYGDQFVRRRRRYLFFAGAVAAGGVAIVAGGLAAGAGVLLLTNLSGPLLNLGRNGIPDRTVAKVRVPSGRVLKITRKDLGFSQMVPDKEGAMAFRLAHDETATYVSGDHARKAAPSIFRAVNGRGGKADEVQLAVERLAYAGSAEAFLASAPRLGAKRTEIPEEALEHRVWGPKYTDPTGLLALPTSFSLAIEMALHEEQERRALEGELAELERAWRDAESIGAIADSLLLPASVERAFERLRAKR